MEKNQKLYDFYRNLDRALFVDKDLQWSARCDCPLPIGHGQTVSQPSLVYRMVELLQLDPSSKVLEIGTGSGYQTAFLAEFAGSVYTVERIRPLSDLARQRLDLLGYRNITYNVCDGSDGWIEHAPYDRIIASCASSSVPDPLIEQLSPGGILIIPVGGRFHQELMEIRKDEQDVITRRDVLPVVFVEFTGRYGW